MRMPFIDTQTGVAQSHCNLFMTRKQRMPGAREGQVYTYPSQRWRKARRQYLTMSSTRWGWSALDAAENVGEGENSSGIPGDAFAGDDSRDGSQTATKDDPKEWFYDDLAIEEMETGEEPDPESDEDYYDDTYANRRKRRGVAPTGPGSRGGRRGNKQPDDTPAKRGRAGRGRKRAGQGTLPYEVPGDAEKPYGCELCGAKYKTRPGLTYHFTHTHKDGQGSGGGAGAAASGSAPAACSDGDSRDSRPGAHTPPAVPQPATEYQDSYVTFLNNPAVGTPGAAAPPARKPSPPPRPASADTSSSDSAHAPLVPPGTAAAAAAASASASATAPAPGPATPTAAASATSSAAPSAAPSTPAAAPSTPVVLPVLKEPETKASPSPYCDFCLGDDRENKKTGTPEELVSCSDCGRSGKRRGRPPRNGHRRPPPCYHLANRVCERHRALRPVAVETTATGSMTCQVVEATTATGSMTYPADEFDTFATQSELLRAREYGECASPPSARQSPARVNGAELGSP
ncbi:unnamed protein product, partial [Iphiclides podalirius]